MRSRRRKMTVKECYDRVGGNYEDAVRRLGKEERLRRLLLMLPNDQCMESLHTALSAKDIDSAFRAVHTLKGILLNLGLDSLAEPASKLTELLRNGDDDPSANALYETLSERYGELISAVKQLQ